MQWVGRVVAERHVEQHLTAVMIRRWLEGLSRWECNLSDRGVRNGTCSKCVVCGTSTMRTGTTHLLCVVRNASRLCIYAIDCLWLYRGAAGEGQLCECGGV